MSPTSMLRSGRGLAVALALGSVGVLGLGTAAIEAAPSQTHVAKAAASNFDGSPLRMIFWSGHVWVIDPPDQPGPHGDPASDSPDAVSVDSHGRLHLSSHFVHGAWRSVLLESLDPIKYGTYHFVTGSSIATLAKPLDFAMYIFRTGTIGLTNELDLENGRSLIHMHGRTSQFVIQPYTRRHHIHRYAIPADVAKTQQQFIWTKHRVSFVTRRGTARHGAVISRFALQSRDVPTQHGEHLYLELFLHDMKQTPNVGRGLRTGILDSYTFTPAS